MIDQPHTQYTEHPFAPKKQSDGSDTSNYLETRGFDTTTQTYEYYFETVGIDQLVLEMLRQQIKNQTLS